MADPNKPATAPARRPAQDTSAAALAAAGATGPATGETGAAETAAGATGGAPQTLGDVAPAAERVVLGADVAGTARVDSLADAAAALGADVLVQEFPGPGVGADRIAVRAERFETVSPRERLDRSGVYRRPALDPADVGGKHPCDVATLVTVDGIDFAPDHPDPDRRTVLLTFKEYSELVAIGAVVARSWPEAGRAALDAER